MQDPESQDPRINVVGPAESIPVYNCPIIISRLDNGQLHGQVASLDGIESQATTEREVLEQIVSQFKKAIGRYLQAGVEIPWVDPARAPVSGQVERHIPVHL